MILLELINEGDNLDMIVEIRNEFYFVIEGMHFENFLYGNWCI